MNIIIFTDLDATLLDHDTYDFSPAEEALNIIRKRNIPLVLCSSKTPAELFEYGKSLQTSAPFIAENGAAIVYPQNSAIAPPAEAGAYENGSFIQYLGNPYEKTLEVLQKIRDEELFAFRGFHDMKPEEISQLTGLPVEKSILAARRVCAEPLVWQDDLSALDKFTKRLKEYGLTLTKGGRFYHVKGKYSKGQAVQAFLANFQTKPVSVALGDSENDISMLEAVEYPVIIPHKEGVRIDLRAPNLKVAPYPGPAGWNEAVLILLEHFGILR